jgi:hypothetical protein
MRMNANATRLAMFTRLAMSAALLLASATLTSARKFPLLASNKAPAASGEANIKVGKGGNTQVEITVRNLVKAENLDPPAKTYVVWFQQEGSPPENEGELKVGQDLKGELKTKTPWKTFGVFITAETDPNILEPPLGTVVMQSKIQVRR